MERGSTGPDQPTTRCHINQLQFNIKDSKGAG